MSSNISLIGMPTAGKSTVGVILAKYINMNFLDTDLLIQQENNALLSDIIDKVGLNEFCKIEEKVVSSLDVESFVIATGGSVVYSHKAMTHLKNNGLIIYLKTDYSVVEQRLKDLSQRGVVFKQGQSVYDLYMERVPLYEKWADFSVDSGSGTPEDVVGRILDWLG